MKPWLLLGIILIIGLILFALFLRSDSEITNYPAPSSGKIVAFGDSLVEGVGASEGNDFVSVLSRKINEPIVNLGNAGDTTEDAVARIDEVIDQNPKIVLLLFGGNDYLKRVPPAETFLNLEKIITTIHESGAVVIVLGVRGGLLKDTLADGYKELAKTQNTLYVPNVLEGLLGNTALMSDLVHPNDAGYQLIAKKVYPILISASAEQ